MSIDDLPPPDTKRWVIRRKSGVVAGIAVGLVLALLGALPATAQDYQKGRVAAKGGDYAAAFKEWRPLADQGHNRAQQALGIMYAKGRGVPRDYAEAVKWFRKAASRGNTHAKYLLGVMYTRGGGVPRDETEAAKWFHKAANRGHARAQYELGIMYSKGWGVPENLIVAHIWFSLSAAKGNKYGSKARDRAARRMTPAQISEAEKLALAWRAEHKRLRNQSGSVARSHQPKS
jgi:TPR repeat protein